MIVGSNSSFLRKLEIRLTETAVWTKLEIRMGSIASGNRKTSKRARATKALSAVSLSAGLLILTRE